VPRLPRPPRAPPPASSSAREAQACRGSQWERCAQLHAGRGVAAEGAAMLNAHVCKRDGRTRLWLEACSRP